MEIELVLALFYYSIRLVFSRILDLGGNLENVKDFKECFHFSSYWRAIEIRLF